LIRAAITIAKRPIAPASGIIHVASLRFRRAARLRRVVISIMAPTYRRCRWAARLSTDRGDGRWACVSLKIGRKIGKNIGREIGGNIGKFGL
jgi:hypothetical protein